MTLWGLDELAFIKMQECEEEMLQIRRAAAARAEPRDRLRMRLARLLTRTALRLDQIATHGGATNTA